MIENDETFFVARAISSNWSGAGYTVKDTYDSLIWHSEDQDKPTEKEFNDAVTAYKTEYDALQYQRDRQYPSIGDQLDMQYHDELNGTTTWKDAVAKVKSDNPKG
jgi:hypothetical protein